MQIVSIASQFIYVPYVDTHIYYVVYLCFFKETVNDIRFNNS